MNFNVSKAFFNLTLIVSLGTSACSFKKDAQRYDKQNIVNTHGERVLSDTEKLHLAISSGETNDLVEILRTASSLDLNIPVEGETALSKSIRRGDFEITALLMSYGASPFVPLKTNGKSAYETIDDYSPRIKSVISLQVETIISSFRGLLRKSTRPQVVDYFRKESLPCELALQVLQKDTQDARSSEQVETFEEILRASECRKMNSKAIERLITLELISILKNGGKNLSSLKLMVDQIAYPVTVISLKSDRSIVSMNPVFLIGARKICVTSFNEDEVGEWRRQLTSLFPNFSGIAYELESTRAESIGISSGRMLISDFERADEDSIALVEEATGIKNFFKCERQP